MLYANAMFGPCIILWISPRNPLKSMTYFSFKIVDKFIDSLVLVCQYKLTVNEARGQDYGKLGL